MIGHEESYLKQLGNGYINAILSFVPIDELSPSGSDVYVTHQSRNREHIHLELVLSHFCTASNDTTATIVQIP